MSRDAPPITKRPRTRLKASGLAWTMLRNSIYMHGLINQAARMVADGRAVIPPNESTIGYVTREDCAAAAAAVLTTPGHENKAYDITGPELLGVRETRGRRVGRHRQADRGRSGRRGRAARLRPAGDELHDEPLPKT